MPTGERRRYGLAALPGWAGTNVPTVPGRRSAPLPAVPADAEGSVTAAAGSGAAYPCSSLSIPEGRRTEPGAHPNRQRHGGTKHGQSQTTPTPDRRLPGDPARPSAAPLDSDATPANPNADTPGHPDARGTLPMARHLTDLAIEDEIQALAAEAPR